MVLRDESGPVGLASRSLLEILQRISSEVSAADWCRPVVQRARLRYLRLRVGHPLPSRQSRPCLSSARIIIHNYGNFSVALMAMHPPLLLASAPPTTPSRRNRTHREGFSRDPARLGLLALTVLILLIYMMQSCRL